MPGVPGRLGTLIYIVAVETPRPEQARHTHLRSYRGNVNNICVCVCMFMCYTFAVTEETRIMCVNVYYTAVLVPGDPLRTMQSQ